MKRLFPDHTIIETEHFIVNQDWEVPIAGFFIVAAKREMRSVMDFSDEEAIDFIRLLAKVRKGMKDILGIEECYIFQNEDTEHDYHLWIFPRYGWMVRFGKRIESVRPIIEYAKKNMTDEKNMSLVDDYVNRMRQYLN